MIKSEVADQVHSRVRTDLWDYLPNFLNTDRDDRTLDVLKQVWGRAKEQTYPIDSAVIDQLIAEVDKW